MNSSQLQKLLREALLNNTYDKPSMDKAIKMTLENSYNYLYHLQKQYIGYEEKHYTTGGLISRKEPNKIGQLYLNKSNYACLDVDFELITTTSMERYRRSQFYKKEVTLDTMINHPEIFTYIPILMIDGMIINNWKLSITTLDNNCTFTLLDKKVEFVLYNKRRYQMEHPESINNSHDADSLIYKEHRIDVFIYENEAKLKTLTGNKSLIINSNTDGKGTVWSFNKSDIRNLGDKNADPDKGLYLLSVKITSGSRLKSNTPIDYFLLLPVKNNTSSDDIWEYLVPSKLNYLINQFPNSSIEIRPFYLKNLNLYIHKMGVDDARIIIKENHTDFMVIEQSDLNPYAMPIPKQDTITFRLRYKTDDELKTDNHGDTIILNNSDVINEYYPNIYSYKYNNDSQVNDIIISYYFYREAESFEHTPMHHWYYTFLRYKFSNKSLENIITDIYNNEISTNYSEEELNAFNEVFSEILHYNHFKNRFGEVDFLFNYKTIENNIDKLPLEYRIETLREWVKVEPYRLRDYVLEQNRVTQMYHVFCNTIDLNSRVRYDDSLEAQGTTTFSEPHYVFSFVNVRDKYPETNNCRVFVDGLFVHELHQIRYLNMDYLYIPVRLFEPDSYVEIELFPEYRYEKEVVFNDTDEWVEFILTEPEFNIFPTLSDLYAYDSDGRQYDDSVFTVVSIYRDREYEVTSVPSFENIYDSLDDLNNAFNNGDFKQNLYYYCKEDDSIYYYWDNELSCMGKYSDIKPVRFTRLRHFKIKPKYNDLIGIPIKIRFSKEPHGFHVTLLQDGRPAISLQTSDFKFQPDYVRVFKNGRLLNNNRYAFFSNHDTPNEYPIIQILEDCFTTDKIFIDITPFSYREIYFKYELQHGELLLDLSSVITKPYDARYYECYINGRRASLNSVMSIDPISITFVNLKSIYSIQIFEKERDWEFFGLDYNENIYGFIPSKLLSQEFMNEDDKNKIIEDIINNVKDPDLIIHPNTNDEEKIGMEDLTVYIEVSYFYSDELIPKGFVNPDSVQFSRELLINNYDGIYDVYHADVYLESGLDRKAYYPEVILLDPDKKIESIDNGQLAFYSVGHRGDVAIDLLSQDITNLDNPDVFDISTFMRDVEED